MKQQPARINASASGGSAQAGRMGNGNSAWGAPRPPQPGMMGNGNSAWGAGRGMSDQKAHLEAMARLQARPGGSVMGNGNSSWGAPRPPQPGMMGNGNSGWGGGRGISGRQADLIAQARDPQRAMAMGNGNSPWGGMNMGGPDQRMQAMMRLLSMFSGGGRW